MKGITVAFAKYCTVAAGAAGCDWLVFIVLDWLDVNYIHAQMTARLCGGAFSFVVNRGWSFSARKGGRLTTQGRRFILLYAFSYCLSVSLLYVMVDMIGVPKYLAKLLADGACLAVNFIAMRIYVFRDRAGFTTAFQKILTGFFRGKGADGIESEPKDA